MGCEGLRPSGYRRVAKLALAFAFMKTALVTGGNRGIGLEVCKQLLERGLHVFAACRDPAKAEQTIQQRSPHLEIVELDVRSDESVQRLKHRLEQKQVTLNILVNNAGIALDGFDAEVAKATIDTNFWGPLRVTEGLLPLLSRPATVVMVSSGSGALKHLSPELRKRFLDPSLSRQQVCDLMTSFVERVRVGRHEQEGWPSSAYTVSKAGLNALTRTWAPELSKQQIQINAICPGWVRTDMGGPAAQRSVEQGASGIVWAALLDSSGPTGGFFRDGKAIDW